MIRLRLLATIRLVTSFLLLFGGGLGLTTAALAQQEINGCRIAPQTVCRGADLSGATLQNASLRDADLTRANLRGASLLYTDLGSARMSGANLTGAMLRN